MRRLRGPARPALHSWIALAVVPVPLSRAPAVRAEPREQPSIVLIVLDDCGVEKVRAYGEGPRWLAPPCTPNLDALAEEGVLFRNVWTDPVCSPARAQILTGRHGFRTGIGMGIGPRETYLRADGREEPGLGLRVDLEDMLPRVLLGYESAAVGKWHLMGPANGDSDHPLDAGFGYYAGSLYNLGDRRSAGPCLVNGRPGYSNWAKTCDVTGSGRLQAVCCRSYATTDIAAEASARARTMEPPWFLYVAFNAPHWPIEAPPGELCPGLGPANPADPIDRWAMVNAMMEVLDDEIGRLLAEIRRIDPQVYVIVVGDNGSDLAGLPEDPEGCFSPSKAKNTVFENGLRIPLIACGPGVVAGECTALVSSTDIYDTIAELAGAPAHGEDSVSLLPYLSGDHHPRRQTVYAEVFTPNQPNSREGLPFAPYRSMRAIRNARYKLVRIDDAGAVSERFHDLELDPCETRDLRGSPGACGESGLEGAALEGYRSLRKELETLGLY